MLVDRLLRLNQRAEDRQCRFVRSCRWDHSHRHLPDSHRHTPHPQPGGHRHKLPRKNRVSSGLVFVDPWACKRNQLQPHILGYIHLLQSDFHHRTLLHCPAAHCHRLLHRLNPDQRGGQRNIVNLLCQGPGRSKSILPPHCNFRHTHHLAPNCHHHMPRLL